MLTSPVGHQTTLARVPSVAKSGLCGPERTLSSLTAVHCEVGWLVGLQAHFLHPWTINLHVLWMAALPNRHLGNRNHSQTAGLFLEAEAETLGSVLCAFTLKGLLGTLTSAQVIMMVCLMALVGT